MLQILQVLKPILTRFSAHYIHQVLLPLDIDHDHHYTSHLINHQEHILQALNNPHHLPYQQGNLSQYHLMNQETSLLIGHQKILTHPHLLNQVTPPVQIPPKFHLRNTILTCSRCLTQTIFLRFEINIASLEKLVGTLLTPTSDPSVIPDTIPSVFYSIIPSSDYLDLLLSPEQYVLPRTSPSGTYIFLYFIPFTFFTSSKL